MASSGKVSGVSFATPSESSPTSVTILPLNQASYLGDALVHISFIVMLYGSDMLAPIELLGPIANYCFLRFFGGDKQKEKSQVRRYSASQPDKFAELQKFRADKNAFWPSMDELSNKWLWTVLGIGGLGIAVEQTLRTLH